MVFQLEDVLWPCPRIETLSHSRPRYLNEAIKKPEYTVTLYVTIDKKSSLT